MSGNTQTQLQDYYDLKVVNSEDQGALEDFITKLLQNAQYVKDDWLNVQKMIDYDHSFKNIGTEPFTHALVSGGVYTRNDVNDAHSSKESHHVLTHAFPNEEEHEGGNDALSATSDAYMDLLQGGGDDNQALSDTSQAFMELIGGNDDYPLGSPDLLPTVSTKEDIGENMRRIENPIIPVEANTEAAEKGFNQQGYRLAVGNNRLTQGNIPKENALVKLLHQRNNLLMNSGTYPVGVPTAILTGSGFNGGGDLSGGETTDVMKFLETNPDTNYRRLVSVYTQLRNEIKDNTGRNLASDFDQKVVSLLDDARTKERSIRDVLVKLNMLKQLEPHQSGQPWTETSVTNKSSDYLKTFYTANQELNSTSLELVNLLSRVAYSNLGYN